MSPEPPGRAGRRITPGRRGVIVTRPLRWPALVLFNSFPFLYLFLPAVVVGYYAVPRHRLRLLLVVLASYYFYAYTDWWFPALMAGSTV